MPLTPEISGDPIRFFPKKRSGTAFTLLELLVCISILAVLLALVIPMASKTIGSARGFKCQMSQRNSAYDFTVFADDVYHGNRGRDEHLKTKFKLDTFVASQYCLEEFWCWEGEDRRDVSDSDPTDALRCPEVRGPLVLRNNAPCESGGVNPWQNVSFSFNMRLKFIERSGPGPGPAYHRVWMQSSILSESGVPLLWDVDGAAAAARGRAPFFSAPSLDSTGFYSGDQYWFPAMRHNGALNVGFVDGHVEASTAPLAQADWRWDFSPKR